MNKSENGSPFLSAYIFFTNMICQLLPLAEPVQNGSDALLLRFVPDADDFRGYGVLHEGLLAPVHQYVLSRLAGRESISAIPVHRQSSSVDLLGYSFAS